MSQHSQNNCCVIGCTTKVSDGILLHCFPNPSMDSDRFQIWKTRVGTNFKNLDDLYISKNRRVCRRHFEDRYHGSKNRLVKSGIPTLHLPGSTNSVLSAETTSTNDATDACTPVSDAADLDIDLVEASEPAAPSPDPPHVADDEEIIDVDHTAVPINDYDELFDDSVPSIKTADPVKWEPLTDVPEAERIVHSGFKCNSCLGEIAGFRYRCVQCADYDLCPRCESSAAHAAHYVLRVPRPAPPAEVRGVLAAVRLALRLPPAADLGPEVKEEPDCVDLAEEVHEAPETAACRVDPLELDAVNQNELEYSSEAEPEFPSEAETDSPRSPQDKGGLVKHEQRKTEPPPKRLKPIIVKAARKRIVLHQGTLPTVDPNLTEPDILKNYISKLLTETHKPITKPGEHKPILVSPLDSTPAAASGGAGGLQPPVKKLRRTILTPSLDSGTLEHRSKPDTLNAAGASAVRKIYLNSSTLRALRPNPLKPDILKLDTTRPVTNAPKPVAVQPEARRPILVSPRGSTAAAASGGAGGLHGVEDSLDDVKINLQPIVRLSRLDQPVGADLGSPSAQTGAASPRT